MKYITFVLLLCVVPALSQDWQWSREIGGEGADGGGIGGIDGEGNVYLIVGYAGTVGPMQFSDCYIEDDTLHGTRDACVAKYDPDGTLQWVKNCVSPSGTMSIGDMVIDAANGVLYMTGGYEWSCNLDTCMLSAFYSASFLAKWDLDGECIWAKNIATSDFQPYRNAGVALTLDHQGHIFLSGVTATAGPTLVGSQTMQPGAFIASYDDEGNELWAKQFLEFTLQQRKFHLVELVRNGTAITGYGPAELPSENDTIAIDTLVRTGMVGKASGLISIDPTNGEAGWLNFEAWPGDGSSSGLPQRMRVASDGSIYCAGSYHDSAHFDLDTLNTGTLAQAYLAKYNGSGQMLWVREFNATAGLIAGGMGLAPDGSIHLTGVFGGTADFDAFSPTSNATLDMFVSRHDTSGTCVGFIHTTEGSGSTILPTSTGVYVEGRFPALDAATGSMTIGNETYTSHGWADIIFAKHDLITSTPPSMVVEDDGLEIYANPNRGSFRLRLPTALANAPELLLRIYNSSGQLVREQQLQMDEERPRMDVWDVGSGLYNVTVTNGRRTYSGSMVVE